MKLEHGMLGISTGRFTENSSRRIIKYIKRPLGNLGVDGKIILE
jgi:hypothetical protein